MANKVVASRESFEDFVGNTVHVGDYVVYATVSGRSPVQKFAVVEKVDLVLPNYSYQSYAGAYPLKPTVRVGVREISNGRGFRRWDTYDWKTHKNDPDKKARVSYPMVENIVLVKTARQRELEEVPQRIVFGDSFPVSPNELDKHMADHVAKQMFDAIRLDDLRRPPHGR